MKFFAFFLSVVAVISVSFAEGDKPKVSMEKRKAHVSSMIDKRIDSLKQVKSCVGKAAEKGSIKACKESHQKRMEKLKAENKAARGK